jgi:hypothetical protein
MLAIAYEWNVQCHSQGNYAHEISQKELYLFGNYIAGTIPKELASLKKLGKHQIITLLSAST